MVRSLATDLELHGLNFIDWRNLKLLEHLVAVFVLGRTEIYDLPLDGVAQCNCI